VVGLGALTFLVMRMEPGRAWAVLSSSDPKWLLVALAAQVGSKACWILRWRTLLASTGHRRGLGELLRLILLGLFFNNFLPTSVGGDVARGLGLAARGVPRATAAASVVGDRLIGLLALGIMAVVGGVIGTVLWPGEGPWMTAGVFALAVVGLIVGLTRPEVLDRFARSRFVPDVGGLPGKVQRVLSGVSFLAARGPTTSRALVFSLGLSACSAVYHWSIGRAVGISMGLTAYFVIVPAVMIVAALPITMNGLGIRELGFVGLLGAQGIPSETATVFALLAFVGTLGFAVAGGLLFVAGVRSSTRDRAGAEEV
jgi:uncharacterized membrane protein YbhN (UPF0104 family)